MLPPSTEALCSRALQQAFARCAAVRQRRCSYPAPAAAAAATPPPAQRPPARRFSSTTAAASPAVAAAAGGPDELVITRPDDWHLHVRDGAGLRSVVPHTAATYGRAIIMPNLVPPVTTAAAALEYKQRVLDAVPAERRGPGGFTPLMTCYLTDNTQPEDAHRAKEAGVVAFKLYPAGATTNSDSGVTDIGKCLPTLRAMAEAGLLLLVHGEVTDPEVDFFDREKVFIETKLKPLLDKVPELRVVMEHITTRDAAEFVASAPANVAASVTPQHLLLNRNALFVGGLRPHAFCLPILKREEHRAAVAAAATSGSRKFFLGTDSAPHPKHAKESACGCAGLFSAPVALPLYAHAFEQAGALQHLEAFASLNGPDFYGLPRNTDKVVLRRQPWTVPASYAFGDSQVVPMWAGQECPWTVVEQ
ncbi:dihydroorotase [Chlorella sorokiniana]|uniref:Dihydroorotase, mitochondrial n=1 Tax=Chlorella sorokiniana TaxID=3076 RepID=A0A2P6TM20_CHLSO|nr:dihydroorotase [Chlorella sorokiniana]|eukprot:PRW45391.1 dihydroorotase [Chlorella sorokiniana]